MSSTPPELPRLPDEDMETRRTLPPNQRRIPQHQTPPPPVQPPPRPPSILPWWSLLLVLFAVACTAAAVIALVWSLRGDDVAVASLDPEIVVLTADLDNPQSDAPDGIPTVLPDLLPTQAQNQAPPAVLALQGPTLEPVRLSPTPTQLGIGATIEVINVGPNGLNVRSAPGTENSVLFLANVGQAYRIVAGPEVEGGLTWWQIQNLFDPNQTGWAAQNDGTQDLLRVLPE